jgi:hypothetical protein
VQLCKNMSIADASHDNTIAKNVQDVQERCETILNRLIRLLDGALDEGTVKSCLLLCSELNSEIEKDVLRVATETCAKTTEFATKSTVGTLNL